ncbi:unnamed protein product, partial [Aphanomyces euteiches]
EYEVQFRQGGPWIWEALVSIPPTELIYEFERVRLGFDRLAMMVQEELHPIEEEEVKDDDQGYTLTLWWTLLLELFQCDRFYDVQVD